MNEETWASAHAASKQQGDCGPLLRSLGLRFQTCKEMAVDQQKERPHDVCVRTCVHVHVCVHVCVCAYVHCVCVWHMPWPPTDCGAHIFLI